MTFPQLARGLVRNYMFQRTRVGRSTLKKLLRPLIPQHQIVELKPGLCMHLDLEKTNHDFLFWFYEEHESSLQWAIKTLLPQKGTFVDCGANLGLMGMLALHHRDARVLFIEPHPRLADVIRKNLKLNGFFSQAEVCEAASSNQDGIAKLYIDSKSDGGHSLKTPQGEDETPIEVKTRRLEEVLQEFAFSHVHFLKIDTEGCDLESLTGIGSFLNPKNIELIYVEMGEQSQPIWDLLTGHGYRAFASDMIYIDRLRKLTRQNDVSQFFTPIEKPGDGNLLWCGVGSTHEQFLKMVSESVVVNGKD
jgi:FkbM family methyltransferase